MSQVKCDFLSSDLVNTFWLADKGFNIDEYYIVKHFRLTIEFTIFYAMDAILIAYDRINL